MSSPIDFYAWILTGILFILLEFDILRFNFHFLAFGIGAFITAIFSYFMPELPFIYHGFCFLSMSVIFIYLVQLLKVQWQPIKLIPWDRKNFKD